MVSKFVFRVLPSFPRFTLFSAFYPLFRFRFSGSAIPVPPGRSVSAFYPYPSQEVKVIQIPVNLPLPPQLAMTGNLATNWKRFYRAWNNYEIAARLRDPNNPSTNKATSFPGLFPLNLKYFVGRLMHQSMQPPSPTGELVVEILVGRGGATPPPPLYGK